MSTIRQLLEQAVARNPEGVALRFKVGREWRTRAYGELLARVRQVSQILPGLGVGPGTKVALMMENRPEWIEAYLGLACCGVTVVPIDAKLTEREVTHILRDSGALCMIASARIRALIHDLPADLADLKQVVLLDGAAGIEGCCRNVPCSDYEQLLAAGAAVSAGEDAFFAQHVAAPDDVASIIYTSGTTGRPKGAMLTHHAFYSDITAALEYIEGHQDDNFLLVLPLHHALAFTANLLAPLALAAESSLVESLRTVGENVREVSPTVMIAVPLLVEKMYARIRERLDSSVAVRLMMRLGLRRLVAKRVLASLGGRLRVIIVGGAPSSVAVLDGFQSLGVPVLEGYGLTETAPIATISPIREARHGSVGKALPGVEVRIVDPNSEGIGEIAVRGPILMRGYYRNEAATREVFDGDWFLTGDLGRLADDGYLSITGRRKSLIVNREGKNIYPEEVEACLNGGASILESLVLGFTAHGETGERVGAIVVPDLESIHQTTGGAPLSDAQVTDLLREEVRRMGTQLAAYKRPRRIQVRFEEFEKTTTQKVKRYLYTIDVEEV